jgi:hypothetical protein
MYPKVLAEMCVEKERADPSIETFVTIGSPQRTSLSERRNFVNYVIALFGLKKLSNADHIRRTALAGQPVGGCPYMVRPGGSTCVVEESADSK